MVRAMRSMRLDDAVDEEFVVVPVVEVTAAMGNNDEDDGEEKLLFRLVSSASPNFNILECFSPDDAFT